MHPTLFKIGSFELKTFGLMLVIGFLLSILWTLKRADRYQIPKDKVLDLAFWTLLSGILGARIAFILQEWSYYSTRPQELWTLKFEGLTSFGGFILGGLVMLVWCKRNRISPVQVFDLAGPPALLAHSIGRIGCFFNGCCYGVPCPPPLGIHFDGLVGTHHPAQLYDMAMSLVGLALLVRLERGRAWVPGYSLAGFFVIFGLSRFVYEFWRAGTLAQVRAGIASSTYWGSLPVTEAQAMALAFVLFGLGVGFVAARRSHRTLPLESTPT